MQRLQVAVPKIGLRMNTLNVRSIKYRSTKIILLSQSFAANGQILFVLHKNLVAGRFGSS
jgi:hypothetical protein